MQSTILTHFDQHAKIRPGATAFARKIDGVWEETSWRAYREETRMAARALMGLGVEPGGVVAVLGFNRPEWTIGALATISAGGAPAGIYTTNAPSQVAYILSHARCRVAVVENAEQWAKVREVRGELPDLRHVVVMDADGVEEDPMVLPWASFLRAGLDTHESALDARIAEIRPEDLATLIYTSGTTGVPKAVMLSHSNVLETGRRIVDLFGLRAGDMALSYLPQAHIAEQMISIHVAVIVGSAVYYAESLDKLAENLVEVRPTIFFAVPRVWERFENGIRAKLGQATGAKKKLAAWAVDVGRRAFERRQAGRSLGPVLGPQFALADRLVYAKLKQRLGFDRARLCASGAAPVAREILEFFGSLGLDIYEVYGLSESCGPLTWCAPGRIKMGTVGPPFPDVEVRLAEDGEVLARGPNIFLGYLHDKAGSAEALEGGWLHTGDVGTFDADGFLTITGRKKELLITSGGKNVAPAGIEAKLKQIDLVHDAVVFGDGRRFLSALLSLDEEMVEQYAEAHGLARPDGGALHALPEIVAEVGRGVEAVNAQLSRVESVREFRILPRLLSIDEGELTPTLKIRRKEVEANWRELLGEIYGD